MSISADIVSDLYRYMTPLELYQRRNLNQLWYQKYLDVLPQWATTIEPWFVAGETGDMKLLEDLLSLAELSLSSYDEQTDTYNTTMIDGLKYSNAFYGVFNLALDKGNHDIALKLAREYKDRLTKAYGSEFSVFLPLAVFDDEFLETYITNRYIFIYDLANDFKLTTKVLTRAYNKGLINDAWLERIIEELVKDKLLFQIITAYELLNIEIFDNVIEPYIEQIVENYDILTSASLNSKIKR